MILLMDKYKSIYKIVKKNKEYYLIQENYDKYKKKKVAHIIVKGINNVNVYVKNNNLKVIDEMVEAGGNNE